MTRIKDKSRPSLMPRPPAAILMPQSWNIRRTFITELNQKSLLLPCFLLPTTIVCLYSNLQFIIDSVIKFPFLWWNYMKTRKCLLHGYILGVLTHTTTWDQHWGGDEKVKWVQICTARLCSPNNILYRAWLGFAAWILGVWGWPKMHIFHL